MNELDKLYTLIDFINKKKPALNAQNLDRMSGALNDIDDRVIEEILERARKDGELEDLIRAYEARAVETIYYDPDSNKLGAIHGNGAQEDLGPIEDLRIDGHHILGQIEGSGTTENLAALGISKDLTVLEVFDRLPGICVAVIQNNAHDSTYMSSLPSTVGAAQVIYRKYYNRGTILYAPIHGEDLWFGKVLNGKLEWLKLAKTTDLSSYLPLEGGDITGDLRVKGTVTAEAFEGQASSARSLEGWEDTRDTATHPNDYNGKFQPVGIKVPTASGIPEGDGGSYVTLVGVRGWTDSTGGKAHELGFAANGRIFHRVGDTNTWGPWRELAHVDDIAAGGSSGSDTTKVSKSGDTMTGELHFEGGGTANDDGRTVTIDYMGMHFSLPSGGFAGGIQYSKNGEHLGEIGYMSNGYFYIGAAYDNPNGELHIGKLQLYNGDIVFANSGTAFRGVRGTVGDNDSWRVGGGATGTNAGFAEIATDDDGTEPIYASQYGGGSTGQFKNLVARVTLLDENHNTSIPGDLSTRGGHAVTSRSGLQVNTLSDLIQHVMYDHAARSGTGNLALRENILGIGTGWVRYIATWQNPYNQSNYDINLTLMITDPASYSSKMHLICIDGKNGTYSITKRSVFATDCAMELVGSVDYDAYDAAGTIVFPNENHTNNYVIVAVGASSNSSDTGYDDYGRIIFITADTSNSANNNWASSNLGSYYSGSTARFSFDKTAWNVTLKVPKGSLARATLYRLKKQ